MMIVGALLKQRKSMVAGACNDHISCVTLEEVHENSLFPSAWDEGADEDGMIWRCVVINALERRRMNASCCCFLPNVTSSTNDNKLQSTFGGFAMVIML